MTVAHDERQAIARLLAEVGPDQPTLCGTWTTRDLLAHLILRERRPDAAVGILVKPLAARTERVQRQIGEQPWTEMIDVFRTGPPPWTIWAIPGVGDRASLFEFFVHHEDIRRAQPSWEPRAEDRAREDALWANLRTAGRLLLRRSPVGVVLRAPGRDDLVARMPKRGTAQVTLVGTPSEITLLVFGRPPELARVVVQGEPGDVAAFLASPRGL